LTVAEFSHSHAGGLGTLSVPDHDHEVDFSGLQLESHTHTWAMGTLIVNPVNHRHDISLHNHDISSHTHSGSTSISIESAGHTHDVTDPSHSHECPNLQHTGYLYHRTEDFRPPYRSTIFIHRVGPNH